MNRSHIGLVILLVGAFLIRLGYVLEIRNDPHTLAPAVDAAYHHQWAERVASGDLGDMPFFRAPMYPWLLGGIYAVCGDGPLPPRILQALLSALTVWLLWGLGRQLFGRTVGWIASIVYTLYGLAVYFSGELLITTLIVFLDMAILWCSVRWISSGKRWQWLIVGLLMGLSAIARPNILIFLPVLIWFLWSAKGLASWSNRLSNTVVLIVGLLIPVLPVTLMNRIGGGEWVFIATQGGVNFYIGNNPEATGAHAIMPEFGETWELTDAWNLAIQETGQRLTAGQLSNFYYKRAMTWIWHHPLDWVKLMIRKTHLFIQRFEISNNRNIYFYTNRSTVLKYLIWVGFGIVAPIGILGMVTSYTQSKESRIIIWFIISYSVGVILFFVTARFRMPVVPGLIVFGSAVIIRLYNWLRKKRYRNVIAISIGGVILFSLCWWNPYGFSRAPDAQVYFSLGNAYLKLRRYSEARDVYRKALEMDPNYEWVHLNIGVSYWRQGNSAEAEKEYRMELRLYPQSETAMNNLGALALEDSELIKAEEWFRGALAQKPYYNDARINLAETLFQRGYALAQDGKFPEAADLFLEAADLAPDRALYRYNLAVMMVAMGRIEESLQHWDLAHRIDPSIPPLPNYPSQAPDSLEFSP
jgi:Tfp pilus assembly protein PilF